MAHVIALHCRTNPQMIDVRGVDDVLIPQRGIGAFQFGNDVGALNHGRVRNGVNAG